MFFLKILEKITISPNSLCSNFQAPCTLVESAPSPTPSDAWCRGRWRLCRTLRVSRRRLGVCQTQ